MYRCIRLNVFVEIDGKVQCLKNPKEELCNGCVCYNLLPENLHRNFHESLYDKAVRLSSQLNGRGVSES